MSKEHMFNNGNAYKKIVSLTHAQVSGGEINSNEWSMVTSGYTPDQSESEYVPLTELLEAGEQDTGDITVVAQRIRHLLGHQRP